MEKKLKLLAVVTVLGAVTIVVAFPGQGQFAAPANQSPSSHASGGIGRSANGTYRQMSGGAATPHSYRHANSVIELLRQRMINNHNRLIREADQKHNEELTANIIKANCYWMLTTMETDEQQHEMNDVWQVQTWVSKDPKWAAVCKAPTMVKELKNVSPTVIHQLDGMTAKSIAEDQKMWSDANERAKGSPGYASKSHSEQIEIYRSEIRKCYTPQVIARESAREEAIWQATRKALTAAQRNEFDSFAARHAAGMKLAPLGQFIPRDNP